MRDRVGSRRGVACSAIMALVLLACGGDGSGSTVSTGKGDACSIAESSCDITANSCQRAVLALTACVRGDRTPALPKVRTITQAEFRAELVAHAQDMGLMTTPWDAALAALRLLPAGKTVVDAAVDTQAQATAAYYDDQTKDVTIIKSAVPSDAVEGMYELSHEFTHYLQDLAMGLGEFVKQHGRNHDNRISLNALIEGDAVVTSTRVLARLMQRSPAQLDWGRLFDTLESTLLDDIASADAPLQAADLDLPYVVGGRYVASVWNAYDRKHVAALFEQPLLALVDWLAGYGAGKARASLLEALDCAPPLAPASFAIYGVDNLGAAGALALLTVAGAADLSLASRLRADAIASYTASNPDSTPDAPTLVVWRLRFADTGSAGKFHDSVMPLGLTLQVFDREIVISASSNSSDNPLRGQALDACPKLDELMPIEPSSTPMAAHKRLVASVLARANSAVSVEAALHK